MFRIVAFVAFVIAAACAFVDDFSTASISLLFIIGTIAVGLALLALDGVAWPSRP